MGFSNGGDTNRKKFTGYERDAETGLDFAQARFYASMHGRFTSPDPFAASALIADPQTFNRYAYVGNNPVNEADPSGLAAMGMASLTASAQRRQSAAEASLEERHGIVSQMEAAWEERVQAAFNGIHEGETVTVTISDPPAESTTHETEHAADASQPETPQNTETASVNVMGGDPLGGSPQKRSDTSGDKEIKTPTVTQQPDPNRGYFERCYNGWRFSAMVSNVSQGTRAHGVLTFAAEAVEIGGPVSLGADSVATGAKAAGKTLGKPQAYASGLNWGIRRMATGSLRGRLTAIGGKVSPIVSGIGAFTAGYNLSVAGQCLFGAIR